MSLQLSTEKWPLQLGVWELLKAYSVKSWILALPGTLIHILKNVQVLFVVVDFFSLVNFHHFFKPNMIYFIAVTWDIWKNMLRNNLKSRHRMISWEKFFENWFNQFEINYCLLVWDYDFSFRQKIFLKIIVQFVYFLVTEAILGSTKIQTKFSIWPSNFGEN